MIQHFKNLQRVISDCRELQSNWNLHAKDCFRMQALLKGQNLITKEKRLDKETEIINSYHMNQNKSIINIHDEKLFMKIIIVLFVKLMVKGLRASQMLQDN